MREYYKESNEVAVKFIEPRHGEGYAKVETYGYPDGMATNSLSPGELREVAIMLNDAADDLEERNEE